MKRRYCRGRDFHPALSIDELRSLAKRRLPRIVFEYLDGAAKDEVTLRQDREIFERIRFMPRTVVRVPERRQSIEILGKPADMPLLIAPTGFNGMLVA